MAAGLIFGTAATFGAYQLSQDPSNVYLALLTSGLMVGVMGPRFLRSKKLFPAGIVAGLSLVQSVRLALRFVDTKSK